MSRSFFRPDRLDAHPVVDQGLHKGALGQAAGHTHRDRAPAHDVGVPSWSLLVMATVRSQTMTTSARLDLPLPRPAVSATRASAAWAVPSTSRAWPVEEPALRASQST